jgi:hypothetical protein
MSMTRNLLLLLFLLTIRTYGQFATIDDKDGYTNVRKEKDINSAIVGRLYNEDVFLYDSFHLESTPNDEWIEIYQNVNLDKSESLKRDFYVSTLNRRQNESFICHGYIHRTRFIPIEKLQQIKTKNLFMTKSENHQVEDSFCLANDSLRLFIKTGYFKIEEHKIEKGNYDYIQKIDGMNPIGTFGFAPRIEIIEMSLTISGKTVDIPKKEYRDLYEPALVNLSLHVNNRGVIYIYMPGNSDGAGGYYLVWIIQGNKYLKRYVDSP